MIRHNFEVDLSRPVVDLQLTFRSPRRIVPALGGTVDGNAWLILAICLAVQRLYFWQKEKLPRR